MSGANFLYNIHFISSFFYLFLHSTFYSSYSSFSLFICFYCIFYYIYFMLIIHYVLTLIIIVIHYYCVIIIISSLLYIIHSFGMDRTYPPLSTMKILHNSRHCLISEQNRRTTLKPKCVLERRRITYLYTSRSSQNKLKNANRRRSRFRRRRV